jgi:hypothetical protein
MTPELTALEYEKNIAEHTSKIAGSKHAIAEAQMKRAMLGLTPAASADSSAGMKVLLAFVAAVIAFCYGRAHGWF